MTLNNLYDYADKQGFNTYYFPMSEVQSISFPDGTIAIDAHKIATVEEKVCLAHEIGHCITDSFYNIYSPLDIRSKHEHRANKWAYQQLLPYDQLMRVVESGLTEVWKIAEYFELTDEFTAKAVAYYQSHNQTTA